MKSVIYLFLILFVITINLEQSSGAVNSFVEKDLTISYKEKVALDKLLKSMEPFLTHDYMKKEIYLIRWIRTANSDVEKAIKLIKEHLLWRKENDVDNIMNEDFKNLYEEYPINVDAVDYDGAPVITVNVADWDTRKFVLSGQADKLYRYLIYRIEDAFAKLRKTQDEGFNVTRATFIEDLKGFNIPQHACLPCLTVQIRWISDLQVHYPLVIGHVIYINTPAIFEVPLRVVLPVVDPETRESIKIFGTNRQEWEKFILGIVPADQLTPNFGGTKPYAH